MLCASLGYGEVDVGGGGGGWRWGHLSPLPCLVSTEKGWRASSSGRKTHWVLLKTSSWLFECQCFAGHICTWDKNSNCKRKRFSWGMQWKGWCKAVWKLQECCICPQPGALTVFITRNQFALWLHFCSRPEPWLIIIPSSSLTSWAWNTTLYLRGCVCSLYHDHSSATALFFFFFKGDGSFRKKNIHLTHFAVCQYISY